ncbi:MAG: hypothetical protein CL402_03105 [Acidiferrobacteraceae bacterium]|nr:hypothetical protein [Acidiferrobacteraceae bacterium]|tara:strand:- start:30195 stop:31175 length:981 start_codon:yes stop_codon:yes gene_type:complete
MNRSDNRKLISIGVMFAIGTTLVIALTADRLLTFDIVGPTIPFAYPWRLVEYSALAQVSAWTGYALHNLLVWLIIYFARRAKSSFQTEFKWYNWAMLAVNSSFIGLHILQTHLFYDGLAQDVPEITALASVALMLMIVLILEAPRRGLAFGKRVRFDRKFMKIVREYHGYFFSWAIIYTFWYHPAESTIGHLAGFFYMFMLFWQSILIFNRTHINRWWTITLETLVIPHGVLVAITQPANMWRMFGFGFAAIFIITQMHGLNLSYRLRTLMVTIFIISVLIAYSMGNQLHMLHEVVRIPIIEYGVVALLYGMFLIGSKLISQKTPD